MPSRTEHRTPDAWCALYGLEIVDPDGWRRADAPSWDTLISLPEFWRRFTASTTRGAAPSVYDRVVSDVRAARAAEEQFRALREENNATVMAAFDLPQSLTDAWQEIKES